jgi:hypothetical protein
MGSHTPAPRALALGVYVAMSNLAVLITLSAAQNFPHTQRLSDELFSQAPTTINISSETVVSGIDLYKDSLKRVIENLGPPTKTNISPPRSELGRTVATGTYEWNNQATSLSLTTFEVNGSEPVITRVEVWGLRSDGEAGTTGNGLKLGDTLSDARRVYGLRLYFGITLSENENQCRPVFPLAPGPMSSFSPTLSLGFNKEGRLNHIKFVLDKRCPTF